MPYLATVAFLGGLHLVVTPGLVQPRLGWAPACAMIAAAVALTGAFAWAAAAYWRAFEIDGPSQGLYFLFMLVPGALLASTITGLAAAWHRRRCEATPRRPSATRLWPSRSSSPLCSPSMSGARL